MTRETTGHGGIAEVRISLQSMRHEIVQALWSHHFSVTGELEAALDKAVASFDIEREVVAIVHGELRRALQEKARLAITRYGSRVGAVIERAAIDECRRLIEES